MKRNPWRDPPKPARDDKKWRTKALKREDGITQCPAAFADGYDSKLVWNCAAFRSVGP